MTEPTRASALDARQRKRIQNRKAQRTYREKLKRRIEDLERWRDVALAFTSTSPGHDSDGTTARYDAAMVIPECESSYSISTFSNHQPTSHVGESPLSGTEQLESSRAAVEEKQATAIAYDDFSLCSDWYPSTDSAIALSEAGTQYSAFPSDFERELDRQEPQDSASTVPSLTDGPVENVPHIASSQTGPLPPNEVDESSVRSESRKQGPPTAISSTGKSAIHLASERGQNGVLRLLLKRLPNANLGDRSGRNALHLAIENNHVDTVKLLLEQNTQPATGIASICVDVNTQDKTGQSPLHAAVASGNLAILDLLLQISDIRIDLYNHDGHTPLHQAITQGSDTVVEMLIEKGADLTLPICS